MFKISYINLSPEILIKNVITLQPYFAFSQQHLKYAKNLKIESGGILKIHKLYKKYELKIYVYTLFKLL